MQDKNTKEKKSVSPKLETKGDNPKPKKQAGFIVPDASNSPVPSPEDTPAPKAKQFQRRKSVASERYDPEADDEPVTKVVHPKTDEQRKRLTEAVKPILLFRALDPEQMQEVVDAMFERKVEIGENVITEGADGDNFYVIDNGNYDIFVGGKKYGVYKDSGSFGELALMYNQPRAATITATSPGTLWAMDRAVFRRIVLRNAYNKRKMYETLLENVPMLKFLDPYERMNVADALVTKYYKDGDVIIKQGASADCMYFVEDGNVRITAHSTENEPDKEITVVNKGGFFGELALVTHKPRAASAFAVGNTKCAVLDIAAFERLMGPCMDIMKRNINHYEEQLVQIFGSNTAANEARR